MLTSCSESPVEPDAELIDPGQQGSPRLIEPVPQLERVQSGASVLGSAAEPISIESSPAKSGTAAAPIALDSSPPPLLPPVVVDASSSPIQLPHRRRRPIVSDSSSSPVRPAVRRRVSNVDEDDDEVPLQTAVYNDDAELGAVASKDKAFHTAVPNEGSTTADVDDAFSNDEDLQTFVPNDVDLDASWIVDEPLAQLQNDEQFMKLVGPPVPAKESNEDMLLSLLTQVNKDEESESTFEDSDEEESEDEESDAVRPRENHRLQAGRRAYDELQDDEEERLLNAIITQSGSNRKNANTLLKALEDLRVLSRGGKGKGIDTKHIPDVYLKNSRAVRLAVLAGLLDADGSYQVRKNARSGHFVFSQSEEWHSTLFWDTVALARGLGFSVSTSRYDVTTPNGTVCSVLAALITGDLKDVPCLLTRKQGLERLNHVSVNYSIQDISLESKATEWAGFRVDKDQLYLRHDHIVLHNSGFEE